MRRALLLLVLVATFATCAPKGFAPASRVDTVRVLAVQAETPFAEPGETVNLRALVVDPRGAGRELRFGFAACTNPGSAELGACVARLGPFEETGVPPDGEPTFSVQIAGDALPNGAPIGSVGVVFAACAGRFSKAARPEGAPVGCVDAEDRPVGRDAFVWGVKRVTVLRGARNANPVVGAVAIDGHRWDEGFDVALDPCAGARVDDCPAERQHQLDALVAAGTAERYLERTEDLVAFFYVSQGAIYDEVARATDGDFPNIYAPVDIDPKRPIDVWVVVRDDRGGVGWAHRTATIR